MCSMDELVLAKTISIGSQLCFLFASTAKYIDSQPQHSSANHETYSSRGLESSSVGSQVVAAHYLGVHCASAPRTVPVIVGVSLIVVAWVAFPLFYLSAEVFGGDECSSFNPVIVQQCVLHTGNCVSTNIHWELAHRSANSSSCAFMKLSILFVEQVCHGIIASTKKCDTFSPMLSPRR